VEEKEESVGIDRRLRIGKSAGERCLQAVWFFVVTMMERVWLLFPFRSRRLDFQTNVFFAVPAKSWLLAERRLNSSETSFSST